MIKTAVVGIGHPHLFSMIQQMQKQGDFDFVAVCEQTDGEAVERVKKAVPGVMVFDCEDRLYRDANFDVVVSSAVNNNKGGIAVRALKEGKSIVFDKPLATKNEDLQQIRDLLKRNSGLTAYVWLTCRYAKGYYTAKRLIEEGAIGRIVHMYFTRPMRLAPQNRPAWMFDEGLYGGILNDIGVHDMDLARWFANCECRTIHAAATAGTKFSSYNMEDTGSLCMTMEDGASVMIYVNWLVPDQHPAHSPAKTMITGTKGMIEITHYPEISVCLATDGEGPGEVPLLMPARTQAEELAAILKGKTEGVLLGPDDGLKSTALALAAQQKALAHKGAKNVKEV